MTGHRLQTLSLIKIENIREKKDKMEIFILDKIKTSKLHKEQPLLILPFFSEEKLCVASALKIYLTETNNNRNNIKELFISCKRPFKAICAQTLSHWIKKILTRCKIDTSVFSGYSTRHASTSAAYRKGLNIVQINERAGWTKEAQTFARFYNRPLVEEVDAFVIAVLESWAWPL